MRYYEIVNIMQNTQYKVIERGKSLIMHNHDCPVSISETEFNYINHFIKTHNLKKGYEVATAFGISMLAAGLAMKETGGQIVTMDAYIEEQFNKCYEYDNIKHVYKNSDGFNTAKLLLNKFDLTNHVAAVVGFSPTDTKRALSIKFDLTIDKLDYVFIDALHTEEAVIQDIESILPYLDEKFALFLHDVHCFTSGKVHDFVNEKFGKSWEVVKNCEHPGNGYNLSVITNLK